MVVTVIVQDILDYLGGTGAVSPRTFYAISVPDATITARGINPATAWYNNVLAASTIAANQTLANQVAIVRASKFILEHLRQTLISSTLPNSYSLGGMTVQKQDLLTLIKDAHAVANQQESELYALLVSAGSAPVGSDLQVFNPIANPSLGGASTITTDQPGYPGGINQWPP